MTAPADSALRTRLLVALALIATIALYWSGLSGPYLFDDFWNLAPVERWHAGQQGFLSTLLPNSDSIVYSRPVAMASFMLTTWLGGVGIFPLKFGNLMLHLACGLLGWWVLRRVLRLDARLAAHADIIAAVATAVWLLHPLHVSTVLYAVQRMAQLATLFTLAAVGTFLVARRQLNAGRLRMALLNLFVAFPLLLALGVLSKQNAAIAGFLCLVLELAYFHPRTQQRRVLGGFFGLFVALPMLAIVALLAFAPQRLLGGYAGWDFTLWERLLTQPRALLDYVGMWLIPRGPQMGLYTDAYPISTGLLSPPTTLLAILALTVISGFAFAVRKRAPSVFAGWFFFLVAHAVESSFLPIEMYYEHRNYLPSFGLLLAVPGLATLVTRMPRTRIQPARLAAAALFGLLLVLGFSTLGRVLVWQHEESMLMQGLRQHPDSFRARIDLSVLQLREKDYAAATETLSPLLRSNNPRERVTVALSLAAIDCASGSGIDPDDLHRAVSDARLKVTVYEVHAVRQLENLTGIGKCLESAGVMADSFAALLAAAARQPESDSSKMHIRKMTAQVYARADRWQDAEKHGKTGWQGSGDLATGGLLVRIYIRNGKQQEALELLGVLEDRIKAFDTAGQRELVALRKLVNKPPSN